MAEINIGIWALVMLALAEFSIQMQVSDLSEWVKQVLWLSHSQRSKIEALCRYKFWRKLLGKAALATIPIWLLFNIHKFISNLVGCPWCSCFWLALTANFFYFEMSLLESLLLAPVALVLVTILDKLHSW